ncbi:MAG: MBOAT family protein [Oscillospiraceae bacterium]|nr:MBOAT family protein [Oscillospiraceae bacterium]
MLFSSIPFIFQFLPLVLLLYYIVPKKLKNSILLLMSLIFYCWGEFKYLLLMFILIIFTYGFSFLVSKSNKKGRKFFLVLMIAMSLSLLITFKYLDFLSANLNTLFSLNISILNLSLPLGISFFTFQNISYAVDVYRGKVEPQKNILTLATYIMMFPQLISGPIVRYAEIEQSLKHRIILAEDIESGMEDFVIGLAQKMLIANNVGRLWNEVESIGFGRISKGLAWLSILAYSLQIYFDFCGYSKMAIGLGKMLGFKFSENFDTPYISRSATEFWRRWHISLGNWFRDYVYIPLGGSRRGDSRTILNLFIVWTLTGLWHGASWNFIIWGLYFAAILIFEKVFMLKILDKARENIFGKIFSHIYALLLIIIGWVIFRSENLPYILTYLSKMFSPVSLFAASGFDGQVRYYIAEYLPEWIFAVLFSVPVGKIISSIYPKIKMPEYAVYAVRLFYVFSVFGLSVVYMVSSSFNPFIYFRF